MEKSRLLVSLLLSGLFLSIPIAGNSQGFTGFGVEIDQYIRESAQRYQVSEVMLRGLIKMEDGWRGDISPTGATGIGQFTIGTWNWLAQSAEGYDIGMRVVTPQNRGTHYDPRKNKQINTLATGLLARWHIEQFKKRGISLTNGNLYLAHNIGLDSLHRALQGKATKNDIKNMRRNGMKSGMSVSHFLAYQKNRYLQHQNEANFVKQPSNDSITASISHQLESANLRWIEPTQTAVNLSPPKTLKMRWIEPSNNAMKWISSTN